LLVRKGHRHFEKLQALKMIAKDEHLFIEAGGFSGINPVGWKSPLIVMKKAAG
jgi:hypothetical protein